MQPYEYFQALMGAERLQVDLSGECSTNCVK
jgi:hypothetical protein